jgi:hypothetical protein
MSLLFSKYVFFVIVEEEMEEEVEEEMEEEVEVEEAEEEDGKYC